MINYCILLVVFLNALFIQAQDSAGGVTPKAYSVLPQEPTNTVSKSATPNCGCIRVFTFDDITYAANTQSGAIPNGYGGLTWVNANYLNTTYMRASNGWNGYATARTSGIFVAYNPFGNQMSMSVPVGQYFQFNSLSLAAAWNNNLYVTIKGMRANILIYQTVITLQVASRTTLYTLKWSNVDKITFNSTGGTAYPGLAGSGTHFAVDDIDITV